MEHRSHPIPHRRHHRARASSRRFTQYPVSGSRSPIDSAGCEPLDSLRPGHDTRAVQRACPAPPTSCLRGLQQNSHQHLLRLADDARAKQRNDHHRHLERLFKFSATAIHRLHRRRWHPCQSGRRGRGPKMNPFDPSRFAPFGPFPDTLARDARAPLTRGTSMIPIDQARSMRPALDWERVSKAIIHTATRQPMGPSTTAKPLTTAAR